MKKFIFSMLLMSAFVACNDKEDEEIIGNKKNGHEWVDLGLSVKWATMNVGATAPQEYGSYIAWGETETATKSSYDWSTYKWCNGSSRTMTKYCESSSYGTVDDKTTLENADDAATANWGDGWRMPTAAEWEELRNECDWEWTSINDVNGYKVKSRMNSNFIFLPAAGFRRHGSLDNAGDYGLYWSRSLDTVYSDDAFGFYFSSGHVGKYYFGCRYYGQSVRPVCPK